MASTAPFGEPSGRLAELFAKTVVPEPYAVTDKIVIQPPTKTEWEQLDQLQTQRMAGNFFLAQALQHGDATDADLAELTKIVNDADEAYNRLFFGGQHDDVMKFFADRQPAHWQAFCADIKAHFLPSTPATGACPHCGHVVDADLAGKDSEPST